MYAEVPHIPSTETVSLPHCELWPNYIDPSTVSLEQTLNIKNDNAINIDNTLL